ncbi:hypothetical protein EDC04DRAFT_2903761 [Pisolithus marmoratus]|nr:hypothetical protein EDC04DRAFT_2903761 [Pisolithus marmoratus]
MSSSPDSAASARRITRSQTTGRPTIRWGKHNKDDDPDAELNEPNESTSLKRSFDASAVDEDTDVDGEQDPPYMPSKMLKVEPTLLLSASSSATAIEDPDSSLMQTRMMTPRASSAGEYTFLDASSSSFTSERRGPRIRTAPPVPVPNLTKKSRGRRVPTAEDTATEATDADGKKNRVYVCKVEDCGKCFSRGEHLKRHIRSIHTHEKPFKCPHPSCDKRFNRNDNLLQHLRVHKGDNSSQTSVDSSAAAHAEQSASAESPSAANNSQRATGRTNTTRRGSRPVRKSKSAASTPPIPAARLAAARVSERSLPMSLPRTYSLPPLPSLAPSYHRPSVVGFMNNTNIAVSSLRTAIDESDGEPDTEDADAEARVRHGIQTLYSFARDLPNDSFRGSVYSGTEPDQAESRTSDVGQGSNVREQDEQASHDNASAKSESASSPYCPEASASRAPTEEATGLSSAVSSATSPLPSAVSA